jgi:hypothetical protein
MRTVTLVVSTYGVNRKILEVALPKKFNFYFDKEEEDYTDEDWDNYYDMKEWMYSVTESDEYSDDVDFVF